MKMGPSKNAKQFVKALEGYTADEQDWSYIGWELSTMLDPRQRSRFVLVWKGYKEGTDTHGL